MIGLTRRAHDLLQFLTERGKTGVPPSFEEMKDHLGLRSKSGVHRLIRMLEERGYIRRLHNRVRAIEVIASPHRTIAVHPKVWSELNQIAASRRVTLEQAATQAIELGMHFYRESVPA